VKVILSGWEDIDWEQKKTKKLDWEDTRFVVYTTGNNKKQETKTIFWLEDWEENKKIIIKKEQNMKKHGKGGSPRFY